MAGATNNRSANRVNRNELSRKDFKDVEPKAAALDIKAPREQAGTYVYIGPSIPRGIVKENSIYRGKFSEICTCLGRDIEKYPKIKLLIVPVERLAEQKQRLVNGGNAVSNTYRELYEAFRKQ